MLASFTNDADGTASPPGYEPVIEDILHWTMAVTLNVLSGAAFSLQMPWLTRSVEAKTQSSNTKCQRRKHGRFGFFEESYDGVPNER
jgi:hypothetical protein